MTTEPDPATGTIAEVFRAFLLLGLTSFGGPVAHLGYFREAFVARRKWLGEAEYADLVALCQALPGPASSQVGIGIGLMRAGLPGAFTAWFAFTLPSALILLAFAFGVDALGGGLGAGLLHGLKIAALAVVTFAVWSMAKTLTPDAPRIAMALTAALVLAIWPAPLLQIALMAVAGAIGAILFRQSGPAGGTPDRARLSKSFGAACLVAFVILLFGLPVLAATTGDATMALIDSFFRTGSLVFGGGHVVLPLLEAETVAKGLIDRDSFLAGYGAAQAVPGPLFAFAAYLGASLDTPPNGIWGGILALLAIYVPSFLLVFGTLPFWHDLRRSPLAIGALTGINAAVVGLLLAALYDPVFTSAVSTPVDLAFALAAFAAIAIFRMPSWLLVVLCAAAGYALEVLF